MVERQDTGNEETASNCEALDVNIHVLLHQEFEQFSHEWFGFIFVVGEHDWEVGQEHLDELDNSHGVDFHGDAEFSGNVTQVVANA